MQAPLNPKVELWHLSVHAMFIHKYDHNTVYEILREELGPKGEMLNTIVTRRFSRMTVDSPWHLTSHREENCQPSAWVHPVKVVIEVKPA